MSPKNWTYSRWNKSWSFDSKSKWTKLFCHQDAPFCTASTRALEKKVLFLAVLNLPFISWSCWSRLKVIWVACQMLGSSLMVIPVEMLLDKGESLQPTKKSAKALWLCMSYQGIFFGPKIMLWSLLLIQKQDNHHSSVHVGHNRSLIRVKFRQATWPWNSDTRLNEMATNDIKVG